MSEVKASALRVGAVAAMVVALAASTTTGTTATSTTPEQRKIRNTLYTSAPFGTAWATAIAVFADRGWPIQFTDRSSGLISTDWFAVHRTSIWADCGTTEYSFGRDMLLNVILLPDESGTTFVINARFRELRMQTTAGTVARFDTCFTNGKVEEKFLAMIGERLEGRAASPYPPPPRPPAEGAFNGACRADKTCDAGLACDVAGERCIAAPASAPPAAPP